LNNEGWPQQQHTPNTCGQLLPMLNYEMGE